MRNIEIANLTRRTFGGVALGLTAAGILGEIAGAAQAEQPTAAPAADEALNAGERIDAGDLNIAYAALGPVDGSPVLLLHG